MNSNNVAYMIRRALMLIPLLIGLSILMFTLIHAAPGDPTVALMGATAARNPTAIAQTRERLGLDKPLPEQYLIWAKRLAQGDFGSAATFNNTPVLKLVKARLWTTLQLQGAALLIALLLAIPIGIISATRQYSALDNIVTVGSFLGISLPNFWLALLLQIWVGVKLHWFPVISTNQANVAFPERIRYFVLPVIVLVLPQVAYFARFMRSSMLEVINQDYVTVARAKGLPPNAVLYGHALRNALVPMITVIGLQLPQILSGAVIIEQIFAWPGLGDLAYKSIGQRDYPVILAVTLLAGAAVMVVNLLTDFVYVLADPRVSLGGRD